MTKTAVEQLQEEAMARLAEVGGKLTAEEDVVFRGDKVILPEKLSLPDAIRFLNEKLEEDEREVDFTRTFKYRPWDGAHATMAALKRAFGMVTQRSTPGFLFFGDRPPQLRTINIGVHETTQVPWGAMALPMLPGVVFELGGTRHPELGPLFKLEASGPRRYRHEIEGVFRLIEHELQSNSIYRGKAFDGQTEPEFLDVSGIDPNKVIYSDDVLTQLEANVWSLLRYTDQMEKLGVSLKRAVLFEGPYGTGKTLGAYLTAQIAQANGWSFVYCRPGRDDLGEVMATARLYQPACVFFEDVDTVAGSESGGTDHVSQLLDIFDGIQAKGTKILCVLTTNHVERVHKGMVRPGRLDAVIHIGALDNDGIERLGRSLINKELLSPDIEWAKVTESMEGFLPAFAKEAYDRAIRYSLSRNRGMQTLLSTADIVDAALGLRPQLELMQDAPETPTPDPLGEVLAGTVARGLIGMPVQDSDRDTMYRLGDWTKTLDVG